MHVAWFDIMVAGGLVILNEIKKRICIMRHVVSKNKE